MNSKALLNQLINSPPVFLIDLPEQHGLYALWDHTGQIRYIGCTPKATEGFRTRIYNKHSTGGEGRSHKFTQAYCCGRMWRYCRNLHPLAAATMQLPEDAAAAKKLRNAFIRKHCKATYVVIPASTHPKDYFSWLTSIETQVQSLAPEEMRAWEGIKFPSSREPSDLVDLLLNELPNLISSTERQNAIYRKHILGDQK